MTPYLHKQTTRYYVEGQRRQPRETKHQLQLVSGQFIIKNASGQLINYQHTLG